MDVLSTDCPAVTGTLLNISGMSSVEPSSVSISTIEGTVGFSVLLEDTVTVTVFTAAPVLSPAPGSMVWSAELPSAVISETETFSVVSVLYREEGVLVCLTVTLVALVPCTAGKIVRFCPSFTPGCCSVDVGKDPITGVIGVFSVTTVSAERSGIGVGFSVLNREEPVAEGRNDFI